MLEIYYSIITTKSSHSILPILLLLSSIFYIRKKHWNHENFRLHVFRCPEHGLTIFTICLPVYDTNLGVAVAQN